MNEISFFYQNIEKKQWEDSYLTFINAILDELSIDNWEFSVTLCDNSYIQEINRDYRDKDKPTDVITFVMSDEPFPEVAVDDGLYSAGDIIISLDTVEENAGYFNVPPDEEFKRVTIHGILHLKGYDHETNDETEEMLVLQEKVLKRINKEEIF